MGNRVFVRIAIALLVLSIPALVHAQPVGKPSGGGPSYSWEPLVRGYEAVTLTVALPDGDVYAARYAGNRPLVFNLRDLPGTDVLDGTYTWELRVVPKIPPGLEKQLAAARAAGDDKAAKKLLRDAGLGDPPVQSGSFQVVGGAIVPTDLTESDANDARFGTPSTQSARVAPAPIRTDQVIADDLIVQGSLCVGFDCVNGESFGFDTIRLKENNTRIKFEDTSTGTFPTTDWQLTANEAASGGASKFSIEDITGTKVPFTIEATAATNSLYIDSTGRIGFRTATPVLDLHVATGDTPAIRLEQNNSYGWTAQTWDIAGNESNFFVRDVTGGSRLPLRIRPGAPTSSLDISGTGLVGVNTSSPVSLLDVRGTNAHALVGNSAAAYTDFLGPSQTGFGAQNGAERLFFGVQTGLAFLGSNSNTSLGLVTNNATKVTITTAGDVGIGTTAPGADLVIANGATTSSINAGSAQFSVASSRDLKENIEPVAAQDILGRIEAVPVVTYDFRNEGPKDRMGLIAEDFYNVFHRGDDKHIDGQDVQMALWLAVQQLAQENKALTERLNALEKATAAPQQ